MPISYVGTGTTATAASGSVTPGLPSGWQVNDIFICIIASKDDKNSSMPSGWVAIDSGTNNDHDLRTSIYYKRAISIENAPTIIHTGDNIVASISAYRGVITSGSPLDVVGITNTDSESSHVTANSINIATDGAMVLFVGAIDSRSRFSNYTGSPTPIERVDVPYLSDYPSIFVADFILDTASATGSRRCTASNEGANNGLLFALKPEGISTEGTLVCITDPSNADIYIDDILQSVKTSASFIVSSGTHTVTFNKAGYDPYTATVTIIGGSVINVCTILVQIVNISDYGIVICDTSNILSCPLTPIGCPILVSPLNYINILTILTSIRPTIVTIRFTYMIDGITNILDRIVTLNIGSNIVYAFTDNIQYIPNTVLTLINVSLI